MKVSDLNPGMLLEPSSEFLWAEIPWRGTDGSIIANYLVVVSGEEDVERFGARIGIARWSDSGSSPEFGK